MSREPIECTHCDEGYVPTSIDVADARGEHTTVDGWEQCRACRGTQKELCSFCGESPAVELVEVPGGHEAVCEECAAAGEPESEGRAA